MTGRRARFAALAIAGGLAAGLALGTLGEGATANQARRTANQARRTANQALRTALAPRASVVVILVDTLRADATSLHGYERETTPFLRRWARQAGVRFDSARAQASCTFPSVNSLLTSRSPALFLTLRDPGADASPGVDAGPAGTANSPQSMGIPASVPTLQSTLSASGYRTLAISASPIVRNKPSRFNPLGGFERGFDVFDEECVWNDSQCVTQRALQALDDLPASGQPFFLYAHYLDPHDSYLPFEAIRGTFSGAPPDLREWVQAGDLDAVRKYLYRGGPKVELTADELRFLRARYDEEVLAADVGIRQLVEGLRSRGLADETIFVVVSDHGEEFFEHAGILHCRTVWEELIHTPMLWIVPGVGPAVVRSPVQNLDVTPTILELIGVRPPPRLEGRSLVPLLRDAVREAGSAGAERLSFSAQGNLRSATDGRWKVVLELQPLGARLFDLQSDPGETRDLAVSERAHLRRLLAGLRDHLVATEGGVGSQRMRKAVGEAEAQLKALGYL